MDMVDPSTGEIFDARKMHVDPFTTDEIDLIRNEICKGATEAEVRMFIAKCRATGLNPFANQIYSIERKVQKDKQWVKVRTTQTSIDGFRLIAERSSKYAGQLGPFWCGKDGKWSDVWLTSNPPAACKVAALRHDFKEPCWGVARFDAYSQKNNDGQVVWLWRTMPDVMISKCAEALALRRAFPQQLSGIYTTDELPTVEQMGESHTSIPQSTKTTTNGWAGPLPAKVNPPVSDPTPEYVAANDAYKRINGRIKAANTAEDCHKLWNKKTDKWGVGLDEEEAEKLRSDVEIVSGYRPQLVQELVQRVGDRIAALSENEMPPSIRELLASESYEIKASSPALWGSKYLDVCGWLDEFDQLTKLVNDNAAHFPRFHENVKPEVYEHFKKTVEKHEERLSRQVDAMTG